MWKYLDAASDQVLEQAKEKLKALGKLPINNLDLGKILAEERLLWPVIGRVFCDMMRALGRTHFDAPVNPWTDPLQDVLAHKAELKAAFNEVYRAYQKHHQKSSGTSGKRVAEIEAEIDRLGTVAAETPSERQRQRYWQQTSELEAELTRIQLASVSLLDRLASMVEQAQGLLQRLGQMQMAKDSQLFRVFLSKIVPRFKRIKCTDGIERSYVEGFQFVPKDSLSDAVGGVMEILDTRTDRDSSPRSTSGWLGRSDCPSPG